MMKQLTILNKARKVLTNNKGYQEAVKDYNKTAKKLTHWGEAEIVEKLIFQWKDENETVVLSNEGSVSLTDDYNEFFFGLDEDFKKAGLWVEAYDGGTFHISEDY